MSAQGPWEMGRGYGTTGVIGSSFAAHSPELKSVKSVWPFHGMAFMTNDAFAVNALGSHGLNTAISRFWSARLPSNSPLTSTSRTPPS